MEKMFKTVLGLDDIPKKMKCAGCNKDLSNVGVFYKFAFGYLCQKCKEKQKKAMKEVDLSDTQRAVPPALERKVK